MAAPDGAQLSEDGNYWWDGSQWQPVADSSTASSSSGGTEVGTLSEDGNYRWDGSQWQPVADSSTASSSSGGAEVGTLSEDGNYWWDGSQWQPVEDGPNQSGGDQPIDVDWSQYPSLARAITYGQDVDAYLQDLGIDPSAISDDTANA